MGRTNANAPNEPTTGFKYQLEFYSFAFKEIYWGFRFLDTVAVLVDVILLVFIVA